MHELILSHLPKARRGLSSAGTEIYPNLSRYDIYEGLVRANVGLDHRLGEQPLIFYSSTNDASHRFDSFLIFTDRRVLGIGVDRRPVNIPYALMEEARTSTMLMLETFEVRVGQTWQDVSAVGYTAQVRSFLGAVYQHAPGNRMPDKTPLLRQTEDDPIGVNHARATMPWPDALCSLLLTVVERRFEREEIPQDIAANLIGRIVIHYRNIHCGRGMRHARWVSPLSLDDLCHGLAYLYGSPLSHREHPMRTLVYPSQMKSNAGAALASSLAGAAVGAVVGIGWRTRARETISRFTFCGAEDADGLHCLFALDDPRGQPLFRRFAGLESELLYKCMWLEDQVLLRRVVYGWTSDLPALMAGDPNHLVASIDEVIGAFDPNILSPQR